MFQIICVCFLFTFAFNLCLCFEEAWREYQSSLRYANREELFITNVTEDDNFKIDANVKKWISLSIGPTCYSIGLLDTGLAILFSSVDSSNTAFDVKFEIKELNKKPLDAILLQSRNLQAMEPILIVTFQDDLTLEWYKIQKTKLESFWIWNLTHPVVHLNAFSVNNKQVLLLATAYDQNAARVDLYQYDVKNGQKYWFWQSLDVSTPITSSAFNNFEFDVYLSLPSLDVVTIYKYEDNSFVSYNSIKSKNVENIVSFEIGFKSFLAIDGLNAAIYQFRKYGLEKEDIANSDYGAIEVWMPVPVKTYRDEVILLAQRNLNYSTHTDYVIEIITYNGVQFEEHADIPCTHSGEKTLWLACLSEGSGIKDSSFLTAGDQLGLIVPKPTNTSALFIINFEVRQISNPLEKELKKLLKQKENLERMIDDFERFSESSDVVDAKFQVLSSRQSGNLNVGRDQQLEDVAKEISEVKEKVNRAIEMQNRTEFDVLTINGVVEIEQGKFKKVVIEKLEGEPIVELLEDIVRKDSIKVIPGDKIINKINVNHIVFDEVNGVKADDIAFNDNSSLTLAGNITVHGDADLENVEVLSGEINGLDLVNEIVDMRNEFDGLLKFEKIKVNEEFHADEINDKPVQFAENNLLISNNTELNELDDVVLQNLTVTNINGDDFDIFLRQLCMINIKCYIPGELKINGNITTEKGSVSYLNDLKFPEEYVFKRSDGTPTTFTGRKTFKNSLTAKEVRLRGKIDGVDTKKLITLSNVQLEIPGTITFKDLEVVHQLNVTGKILGEQIDKFLPNPTLQIVNNISANVIFENIEVDGNIIIKNDFNHSNFEELLNDLIYKDEEEASILSEKNISHGFTVKGNLEIESNSINNISLDSIITKDTDQILDITLLKGDVVMANVEVTGKYNGENVTQIDQNLVKLNEEQNVSSTLVFEDLEVEDLRITETLNNATLEKFISKNVDTEVDTDVIFEKIQVGNIIVEGNFTGNITGFDIKDFNKKYLSYSKDQTIDVHYDIVHSTIDNLKVEHVNGEEYEEFFTSAKFSEKVREMLGSGKVAIKDLDVKGRVYVETINEKNNSLWLPRDDLKDYDGKYKRNLTIEGNIFFNTLEIERLSNVNWTWLNNQVIRKDEVNTVIDSAYTKFLGGIKVSKLIETKKINGIPINDILTKQGQQTISGPITIKGDVVFKESAHISENLNEIAVTEILNNLDIENGTYTIRGDMLFNRVPRIYNLNIKGQVNNKNITEYLSHVVHLDEDCRFYDEFVFEGPVSIDGNLAIEQDINDINLSEVGPQIVLTTEDAQIQGLVTFTKSVVVKDHLTVEGDLNTATLYDIDLDEWKNNSVYLDEGMVNGTYGFNKVIIKDSLIAKKLNGINMDSIIPLKSNQTIDHLEFGELTAVKDISVMGLVNGYSNLSDEFENTVMDNKDQTINSNIVFNKVILIRENLFTDYINGIDVSKIVTTDTDQNITNPFNFKSQCKIDSDLHVHGLVNGINTTAWKQRNVKIHSPEVQKLDNDWKVSNNMAFLGDIGGAGFINDLNLTRVMGEVENRKNYKFAMEYGIIEDYKNMCKDVSYLYQAVKKQIYKFKYFEELHTITLNDLVQHVHYFQFKDSHYLLVNDYSCTSQLLIFKNSKFEHLNSVSMGHISQAIVVKASNSRLYLVTRDAKSTKKCEVGGTNVWSLSEDTIELYYNIEEQDLLQESIIPLTFYGLSKGEVVEYKINFNVPRKYRTWTVSEENAVFVPRGLKTGLALSTGNKLMFLDRSDPIEDNDDEDADFVIRGNTSEVMNFFVPGRLGGDVVVTKVGIKSARKHLLAVATHEETSVRGRLDFVKIYSDALKGDIFHKVPAYKPTSLLSVEFDQGETLLVFLENRKLLQVYEYKGIEGFQHRTSARVEGSQLFLMTLPIEPYLNPRKAIGIVNKNKINIIYSIMAGNQIRDDLKCGL